MVTDFVLFFVVIDFYLPIVSKWSWIYNHFRLLNGFSQNYNNLTNLS